MSIITEVFGTFSITPIGDRRVDRLKNRYRQHDSADEALKADMEKIGCDFDKIVPRIPPPP